MTTSFTSLPIVDLGPLAADNASEQDLHRLSSLLHDAFATVGFAYLVNVPLSFLTRMSLELQRDFLTCLRK